MSTSATELCAELFNNNKFLTHILNSTVDTIKVIDKEGKRIFANNAMCIILGAQRNELIGYSIFEEVYEADKIKTINILKRVQEENNISNFENRLVKRDGTLVYMSWSLHWDDISGFVYLTGRDITVNKQTDIALSESQKRFETYIENATDAMFIHDFDGNFIDANKQAYLSLGYTKAEFLSLGVLDIDRFFNLENARMLWIKLKKDNPVTIISKHLRKNGTQFPVEVKINCFEMDGQPCVMAFARDISARIQAEFKLEGSEERFRSTIENLSVGIIKYNPSKEIMICNKAALKMLGLTKDQLMGITAYDPMWKVIHEDGTDFPLTTHPVSIAITTNKAVRNEVMGVYRPKTKDSVWLRVNAIPQFFADGKLESVTVTSTDITEKKKMEAEIASQLKRYRMLMHTSQDFIIILDGNGKLVEWNNAFAKHLGYPENKIAGMYPWDWSPTITKETVAKMLADVKEKGFSFEAEHLLQDGSLRSVDVKLNKFVSDGYALYYASARDITDLKNNQNKIKILSEELRELSVYIQNLIEKERANLAKAIHDQFAQPFVAIRMNAELIRQKIKDKNDELTALINEQIEMSHHVISASKILFNSIYPPMLEDLGLIAAIEFYFETGNLKFCSFQFDLNTNIRDEVLPKEISLALFRIFQESMTNIAQYAKATKVTAAIYMEEGNIEMRIEDNGIGFVTASINTKEQHGLLVMRERAFAMNGSFSITSILFKGTTVEVVIPVLAV